MTKTLLILCILATAAFSSGCAKLANEGGKSAAQQDTISGMQAAMQLPVPDSSYADAVIASGPKLTDSNKRVIKDLIDLYVDVVAKPLRESRSHFGQLNKDGERRNGSLQIVHAANSAELKGTRDDSKSLITWNYSVSGVNPYFSGTTSFFGTAGDLVFPANANLNTPRVTMHWDVTTSDSKVVRTTNVRLDNNAASLTFTQAFTADSATASVVLSGFVNNGSLSIGGKWDAKGGYIQEGSNAAKRCWNANFVDTAPVNDKCPNEL